MKVIAIETYRIIASEEASFLKAWDAWKEKLLSSQSCLHLELFRASPNQHVQFEVHAHYLDAESQLRATRDCPFPRQDLRISDLSRVLESFESLGAGHRTDYRSAYLDTIVEDAFAPLSHVQERLLNKQRENKLPPIHVGRLEGKLLEIFARLIGARKGIEIGTLGGFSAICLLRGMHADAHLISIEKDAKRAQLAREALEEAGESSRVEIRCGDANQVLENLRDINDLDFVFIDADKENYASYIEWALPHLRVGGLILADNAFLWGGMLYFGQEAPSLSANAQSKRLHSSTKTEFEGMSRAWKLLSTKTELSSVILPTGEGLALAVKIRK